MAAASITLASAFCILAPAHCALASRSLALAIALYALAPAGCAIASALCALGIAFCALGIALCALASASLALPYATCALAVATLALAFALCALAYVFFIILNTSACYAVFFSSSKSRFLKKNRFPITHLKIKIPTFTIPRIKLNQIQPKHGTTFLDKSLDGNRHHYLDNRRSCFANHIVQCASIGSCRNFDGHILSWLRIAAA